jgi:hypothetical protein
LNEFCKAAPQELNLATDALLVKTVASRGVEIEIKTTLQTQKLNFVKNVTVLKTVHPDVISRSGKIALDN